MRQSQIENALHTWDGMITSGFVNDPYPHVETTLSEILQTDAPEKYSLSAKACAGILRRAKKRQKELPPMLKEALMEVIGLAGGIEMTEEEPDEEDDIEEEIDEDDSDSE